MRFWLGRSVRTIVLGSGTVALAAHAELITPTPAGSASWVSLGPAAERSAYNASYYNAVDTGRVNAIRVDPSNPEVVYLATSGGGVWRTANLSNNRPDWIPLTDALPALAIGSMDVDPSNPNRLLVGLGDWYDQAYGAVVISNDSGATWSAPLPLTSVHPADGGLATATRFRDIRVDPGNPNIVLAGTDVGLFRSTDAGSSFTLIDLPNAGSHGLTREAIWSITYTGAIDASHWAISGVYACPGGFNPPAPAAGTDSCVAAAGGNLGDVWLSSDAGATWTSVRASNGFPSLPPTPPVATGGTIGRIALGAGPVSDPATTTLYAAVSSVKESSGRTEAILTSLDGGASWSVSARSTTPLANPSTGCKTLDLGGTSSFYALQVAVDPGNANRVLIGGTNCSARSVDGGATWHAATHWLPSSGQGDTDDGRLPYVHLFWHAAQIFRQGDSTVTLGGTDGGFFLSRDLFDRETPEQASWFQPGEGLVTHLTRSVASGDPTQGNGNVLFIGTDGSGTRVRLSSTDGAFSTDSQIFDQVFGGEAGGTALTSDPTGQNATYWSSANTGRRFCRPDRRDCSLPTRVEADGNEYANWGTVPVFAPSGDSNPFYIRYSPIPDAAGSVLTTTNLNVWKLSATSQESLGLTRLTPIGLSGHSTRDAFVSPFKYTIDGRSSFLYGVGLSGGFAAVIVDDGSLPFVPRLSSSALHVGTDQLVSAESVSFPHDAANLGGVDVRQTYVVTSIATATTLGAAVPEAVGHVLLTTDGGANWLPFHGDGSADLPNVPTYLLRFDPSDATDSTIYAGTEFGLYRSTDRGRTWARYGVGLPAARVTDIFISKNGSLIRVSTYGRGVWEIQPRSEAASRPGNGDWDGNGFIDFRDVAALAIRLGTQPGGQTNPRYDSTLDLNGTPTALEDADLSAVLAKLGGTP